jgi:hypothetical protein
MNITGRRTSGGGLSQGAPQVPLRMRPVAPDRRESVTAPGDSGVVQLEGGW